MIGRSWTRYRDVGLLILRVGIGGMFVLHGLPKLLAGPELWQKLGGAVGLYGIHFAPTFWGFMAGLAECGGGVLLMLGLAFRPALLFMLFVMVTAATGHITRDVNSWKDFAYRAGHAVEMGLLFLSLLLIGPGKYSIDRE